ncbi:MAG: hypothetical protein ACP5OV_03465 [Acidimicrobiales bacterium]
MLEMLITFLIIPVLIGAATFSLIGLMKGHATVANRLTSSADAQVVSSSYFNDLQSASQVTLDSSALNPVVCPPNLSSADAWLLGFQVPATAGQSALDVAYGLVPSSSFGNSVSTLALVRWQCSVDDLGQVTYDAMTTLASHVPSPNLNVSISGVSCSATTSGSGCLTDPTTAARTGWISTYGIQAVIIDVVDTGLAGTGGGWSYSIGASPRNWVRLVKCTPPGQGLCPSGTPIQSPGLVLGVGGQQSSTSFNGNPCSVGAVSVGLNGLTISQQGNSNPFSGVTNVFGTGYGSPSQTIYLGHGHSNPLTITYGPSPDPLAGDTVSQAASLLGYTSIVYLGSSWPSTFTPGTVYVIGSTTPTTIPTIDMSSSGGSILLWSNSAPNIAAPAQLTIKGSTIVNLGTYGILYAPQTTLSIAGNAKLTAESVIVQNLTCNGGGTGNNLTLTSSYPNA